MKSLSFIVCISFLFVLSFSSCFDEGISVVTKVQKLSGFIQIGPFQEGTSILVSELNEKFAFTGKSFRPPVIDNQGTFELFNFEISSPYLELKASGKYFNEVTGEPSNTYITLFALADNSNLSTLNVNVLSTLEKDRVKWLVVTDGIKFAAAKKKAMEEILAIFSLSKSDIKCSELLDINKSGDGNAILLAISAILQGSRSEAELSDLLAKMSEDIRTDGHLDREELGTSLISHAKLLSPEGIKANLVKQYNEIGIPLQIPEFEKYIDQFIENSKFKTVSLVL